MNEQAIEALIREAKSPGSNEEKKWAAINKLGKVNSSKARDALVWVLHNDDFFCQTFAISALEELGDPKAVPYLMKLIEDESPLTLKKAAVKAVGNTGSIGIRTLIFLFESINITLELKEEIAKVLKTISWIPTTVQQKVIFSLVERNWDMLEKFGEIAVPHIMHNHHYIARTDKEIVLETLVRIGEAAVDRLIDFLDYEKDYGDASRTAAIALGRIGDPKASGPLCSAMKTYAVNEKINALLELGDKAIPALIEHLQDESKIVRRCVAQVIGMMEDSRFAESLIAQLRNEDNEVRYRCAEALGRLADNIAVKYLIKAAETDRQMEVREIAVWALGEIDDPKCITFLTEKLNDQSLRYSAARSLGSKLKKRKWTPKNIDETAKYYLGVRQWNKLLELGDTISGHFLRWLDDPDEEVQFHSALFLAKLGYEEGFLAIQNIAEIGNHRAAEALGELGDRRAIPVLIGILERVLELFVRADTEAELRGEFDQLRTFTKSDVTLGFAAARALSKFRESMVIRFLVKLLIKHPDHHVREYAAKILEGLWPEPKAISSLQEASEKDVDHGVRSTAKNALNTLKKR